MNDKDQGVCGLCLEFDPALLQIWKKKISRRHMDKCDIYNDGIRSQNEALLQ